MITRHLLSNFATLRSGACAADIDDVTRALGHPIPDLYRSLLLASDGLTVESDDGDLHLYGTGEIVERNETFETWRYFPGLIRIGSDGGGTGIHIDVPTAEVVAIDDGCPSVDDGWIVATSITDWIERELVIEYPDPSSEYRYVRLVLVSELPLKKLAALKACLKLSDSIVQLRDKARNLPLTVAETRLDLARVALSTHPELVSSLIAEDKYDVGVRHTLVT